MQLYGSIFHFMTHKKVLPSDLEAIVYIREASGCIHEKKNSLSFREHNSSLDKRVLLKGNVSLLCIIPIYYISRYS